MMPRIAFILVAALMVVYAWPSSGALPSGGAELASLMELPRQFSPALSIAQSPLQHPSSRDGQVLRVEDFLLTLVTGFEIEARVLARKDYRNDIEARLSPLDLALGWGPMAEGHVVEAIRVRQAKRWYHWHADHFPIPRREIERNSANMHIIPASDEVRSLLQGVNRDQAVRLYGYLVNVDRDDGWQWRTSLTRNDTGAGACEIVLVTLAEVYPL